MRLPSDHRRFVTVAIIYAGTPGLVAGGSQEIQQMRFKD